MVTVLVAVPAAVVVVMKKTKDLDAHLREFKVVTNYARIIVYPKRADPPLTQLTAPWHRDQAAANNFRGGYNCACTCNGEDARQW
jgi:hypothetical protein